MNACILFSFLSSIEKRKSERRQMQSYIHRNRLQYDNDFFFLRVEWMKFQFNARIKVKTYAQTQRDVKIKHKNKNNEGKT